MSEPATESAPAQTPRFQVFGAWLITVGLAAVLVWTTLCLGGWLADTMVYSGPAMLGLAALGGLLLLAPGAPALNLAALLPVPFVIYAAASAHWVAPAKWLAWREVWLWLQMALFFLLVLHFVRTRGQRWLLVGTMVALGLTGVVLAAYQRFVDPRWMMLGRTQAEQFINRSGGMFGIPNSLAGLLELMLPLCLVLVLSRRASPPLRLICAWLAGLFGFAVVLTGSRGGWLALGAVLALWPLVSDLGWRRKLLGAVLAVALLVGSAAALYHLSEPARHRMMPFLSGQFEPSRPLLWRAGLKLWQEAPWLGTGAASYNVLFDRHRPARFLNEPEWTHNDYLNTLSDYGVVGFVAWFGAGAAILLLGWRVVREARRRTLPGGSCLDSWRWSFGLWLGLVAFGLHLIVDFHTKIPALAFAAALAAGLLLGGEAALRRAWPWPRRILGAGVVGTCLPLATFVVVPAYQAEALRYEARRRLNHVARGWVTLDTVLPASIVQLQAAVKLNPMHGAAWGDLAYATTLTWHVTKGDRRRIGQRAEDFASRAIAICPELPAIHLTRGTALGMQGRLAEAEASFRQALVLGPNNQDNYYNYAHFLSDLPGRDLEAIALLHTCLSLDPGNSQAVTLRERLSARR